MKPIVLSSGVGDSLKAAAFHSMANFLAAGGRLVVGFSSALDEGETVGRDGERHLVIKCRATRQDFLDTAPVRNPEERAEVEAMHAPFYYELELWDQVLERPDGSRLGIRIREQRRTGGC